MPLIRAHDADDLVALFLQRLQIVAEDLDGQLAFHAADGFFHVVGDGLREIPDHAGNLLELAVHGRDQLFLVLVKHRPPFFLGLQIDEIFGVEEAGGIGAVVGPAHLAGALRNFGKRAQDHARLVRDARCPRSARCWAPACRAPRWRLHPDAAETPSRAPSPPDTPSTPSRPARPPASPSASGSPIPAAMR